ncbi:oxygenase-like protein [Colletotrichum navitas]|uniref:Oxygenase-like protein n=1 Tax=Colletotrichum navitas TaxID=681940 RepID=A0AAD8VB99_9PEZI|nr:oxygenase-like protein [Colletotrichum navitas]KAK1598833.1 oxygenase-like protein [Colletotrichum navitas]
MATQSDKSCSTQHQGHGLRVAIVGAGLTGLITAQALKKEGFEVTVFERDSRIDERQRDWTILLHWAMATLREILPEHILNNFPKSYANPHLEFNEWDESVPFYDGLTGELMFRNPVPGARRISRLRLRQVLVDGLDMQWGKDLEQIIPGQHSVELRFKDGNIVTTDYVLGADGPFSKVRELLVGVEDAKPLPSGFSIANCICKYGDAEKVNTVMRLHPVFAVSMSSLNMAGCGVQTVLDPSDVSTWETFWVKIFRGHSVSLHGPEAIEYTKKDMAGICQPFRSILEWTPKDSPCTVSEMKYWMPTLWETHEGRVQLAGDAAHPMLPFRGQGLQHAIVDVEKYLIALKQVRGAENTIAKRESMKAYQEDVVKRGGEAVTQSLQEAQRALETNEFDETLTFTQGHGRSA